MGSSETTTINDNTEVIGCNIFGKPLINIEDGLGTRFVGTSGGDLHVVAVPPMVVPRSV